MNTTKPCKEYVKPRIILEFDLETKAGSPIGFPIDPLALPGAPEG